MAQKNWKVGLLRYRAEGTVVEAMVVPVTAQNVVEAKHVAGELAARLHGGEPKQYTVAYVLDRHGHQAA